MDLGEMLYEFVMGIFLTIDGIVYTFINWIYQIILIIADQNIFGDSAIMENFVGRIYTIIGVIMLFVLAYSLLKSMINPDELTKGKQSPAKIITNVIISIAIIALAPTVFNFAMQFQSALLEQNTIGRIIIGSSTSSETSDTISRGGREMALGVLNAFIFPSDSAYCNNLVEEADSEAGISNCEIIEINSIGATYGELMDTAANTNLVTTLPELAGEMGGSNPRLTYYFLVSTAAGIFVLFVLVSYCIEIAIRMIKLAVFQFITPIPAIARVMPNEQAKKVFDNWVKACLSTYLEVFIRLALLFFAVFIISIIREQITEGNLLGALFRSSNPILGFLAQAFIIIGIVMFIKQAPGIIKDITGLDGGKFNVLKSAKQGFSFLAGGVSGRSPAASLRAYEGSGKSERLTDFSAIGNQRNRRLANLQAKEEGANLRDRWGDRVRQSFGYGTKMDTAKQNIERGKDIYGNAFNIENDTGEKITLKDEYGRVIDELEEGKTYQMTEQRLNNLKHQKDLNKRAISEIEEQARQLEDFKKMNARFIDIRSQIKNEAIDKIGEGDSAFKDVLKDEQGNTIVEGNYKTLADYYQTRVNAGASPEELQMLNEQLKQAQERLWKAYADNEITVGGQGTKIGSLFAQAKNFYDSVGGFYDAATGDIKKLDASLNLDNMEFFEGKGKIKGIDKESKSNNSELDIKIGQIELGKSQYNSQNTQIDRLLAQHEEAKTAAQSSPEMQRYKASDAANKISDSGKRGN